MSSVIQPLYAKLSRSALLLVVALAASCGGDSPSPMSTQWYATCGDPACHGYNPPAGVPLCTTQKVGDACTTTGSKCDPMDSCDALLICTTSDPKAQPGGCPISRQKYKTDIQYLDESGLQHYADELSKLKLATYKYKTGGPTRLGFIIEDQEPSVSVNSQADLVDLYGYTSLAVAALKRQEKQIAALEQQVRELSAQGRLCVSRRETQIRPPRRPSSSHQNPPN
jgi:hypothetical protein